MKKRMEMTKMVQLESYQCLNSLSVAAAEKKKMMMMSLKI